MQCDIYGGLTNLYERLCILNEDSRVLERDVEVLLSKVLQ